MRTERTPQITTRDTHRPRLIRGRFAPPHEYCPACGREARWLTTPEAATLARTEVAEIDARLDAGLLHASEAEGGGRRVCLTSLVASE